MTNLRNVVRLAAAALVVGAVGVPVAAWQPPASEPPAETPQPAAEPVPPVRPMPMLPDEAAIKAQLEKLAAAEGVDPAEKEKRESLLKETLDERSKAVESAAAAQRYANLRDEAPQRVAALEKELEKYAEPPPPVPASATAVEVEQMLGEARASLAQAEETRSYWDEEPIRRTERGTAIAKRRAELQEQQRSVAASLEMPPPNQPPEVAQAFLTLQRTRLARIEAELQALEKEKAYYDSSFELLKLERHVAPKRAEYLKKQVAQLEEALRERREREAAELRRQAREAVANAHPAVAELARANQQLAELLEERRGQLTRRTSRAHEELDNVEQAVRRIRESRADVEAKLEVPGMASALGRELIRERMTLPHPGDLGHEIRKRQAEVTRLRLEVAPYAQELSEVQDPAQAVDEFLADLDPPPDPDEREDLARFTRELLEARRRILDELRGDYNRAIGALNQLNIHTQELLVAVESYSEYLADHSRWVPNTDTFTLADLSRTADAAAWLLDPYKWRAVVGDLGEAMRRFPAASSFALLVLVFLTFLRERLRRRLRSVGERASRSYTAPYKLTTEALGLSFAIAAVFPLLVFFIGWRLWGSLESNDFSRAVGAGLIVTGIVYATLELVRQLLRHNGLVEAHFHWRRQRIERPRRHLRWLTVIGLPIMFVVGVIQWDRDIERWETLGRLALIAEMLLFAVFAGLVYRPIGFEHEEAAAKKPPRWERPLHLIATGVPLLFAVLVYVGYQFAIWRLFLQLLETVWLVLAVAIAQGVMVRWLYYSRGRLALEQARQRREAASAEPAPASGSAAVPASGELTAPREEPAIDLATVNVHTRRILRTCVTLSVLVGFWLIWYDELPAFGVLDQGLWPQEVQTTTWVEDGNGLPQPQTVTEIRPITVADVLFALVLLGVALNAAQNVPGLLEVLVLQYLPMDAGARYASATLVKYLLTGIGAVLALAWIGVGWGEISWVVAGLSVGLGFGLQEVLANFVCGLILLFERPIRVGDVVTIGEVDGMVTKIQIRATTIRNWDRKEYVVPNKDLITGTLMNWTLTDSVQRVTIVVGIAYGSDVDKARAILAEILDEHPNVLKDPAPFITFENFGDSTLDIAVRAYLPNIDNLLNTKNDLYTEIHRRFGQRGIEIAFPQRDLRVRSVGPLEKMLGHTQGNGRAGDGNGAHLEEESEAKTAAE